jgi:homoserine O-acetyltransferase/O-succinyltransferase
MRETTTAIGPLQLDCGTRLANVEQRVTIYGRPSPDGTNVVLVEHALTGSSRVVEWWPGIVGEGALFDPARWCVVGINALGSCYGSTRSAERITVRDIVRAERHALAELGIERVALVIGGSLGGMRALQWALDAPDRVDAAIMVGAHDHHSAMGLALNSLQREAIDIDPIRGLRLARKLAMLSYKSDALLRARHDRRRDRRGRECFDVEGYLERQADIFEARMDAVTYATLTHAMDSFDVRDAGAPSTNGATRTPALLFVGITTDWLFRAPEVRAAAERFAQRGWNSQYLELPSDHGHDAFLAESVALRGLLEPHIALPLVAAGAPHDR